MQVILSHIIRKYVIVKKANTCCQIRYSLKFNLHINGEGKREFGLFILT